MWLRYDTVTIHPFFPRIQDITAHQENGNCLLHSFIFFFKLFHLLYEKGCKSIKRHLVKLWFTFLTFPFFCFLKHFSSKCRKRQQKMLLLAFSYFFWLDALWLLSFIHLLIYKREIRSQRMVKSEKVRKSEQNHFLLSFSALWKKLFKEAKEWKSEKSESKLH